MPIISNRKSHQIPPDSTDDTQLYTVGKNIKVMGCVLIFSYHNFIQKSFCPNFLLYDTKSSFF